MKITNLNKNFIIDEEKNTLNFKKVYFKYQNSKEFIFENLDMEFTKGTHTIIT